MRKLLLLAFPCVILAFSSFTPPKHRLKPTRFPAEVQQFDPRDWIIDDTTAQRMIDNLTNCRGRKCRDYKKKKFNHSTEMERYLNQDYTIQQIYFVQARYGAPDVPRYRKSRHAMGDDGDVDGYTTVLTVYKVKPRNETGFLLPVFTLKYVDNATICPPPTTPPCD